jgi:hypothetical protein
VKVDCNECGASLALGETTRFLTCAKCASRLKVVRSGNSIYTEVVGPGVTALKEELARLETEPISSSVGVGESESVLRLIVGGLLVASDIYWWVMDPTLQSLYVRILLLAAGGWLILSGALKVLARQRERLRALADAKALRDRRRHELRSAIAADGDDAPRSDAREA